MFDYDYVYIYYGYVTLCSITCVPSLKDVPVHTFANFITDSKNIWIFNTVNCLFFFFSRNSLAHISYPDIAPVTIYICKSLTEWGTIAHFTPFVIRVLKLYFYVLSGMEPCILTSLSQ